MVIQNRHKQRALLAGTIALSLAPLTGCRKPADSGAAGSGSAPGSKTAQPTATQIRVTRASYGSIAQTQQVTGALNAENDVTVGSKLAGKIAEVYKREGDQVTAGTIVVQQDTSDLQAQQDSQRANLAAAHTRLDQAYATLRSAQAALRNARTNLGLIDKQTQSAVRQAQAGLSGAQQSAAVVKNGARTQERQQAQQAVAQAQADRESNVADLASAQADADRAQSDLRRYQQLYTQKAIPAQQLDQARAVAQSGQARVNAAKARVTSADARVRSTQENLSLIQEGSRTEDVLRAESTVEQARQTLVTAQTNRGQVTLRQADVVTAQAGVQQAQAGIPQAEAGVRQAEAALRLASQALADAAIRSPIGGIVAERKVERGQQVAAGFGVMRIVDVTSIYFDAQLPEALYAQVTHNQPVSVTVSAFPTRAFNGHVSKLFPVASSGARNFTVRISLQNAGSLLRPQMFARGEIVLNTHPHSILIARDAVLDNTGATGRVFVVNGKTAEERQVKIGFANIKKQGNVAVPVVEITSGLREGEQVVTEGQGQLQDKVPVQILDTPTANQSAAATP